MLNKIVLLMAFIAFISSSAFAQSAKLNEQAPDFTLTDSKGKSHKLSDFKNKTVVLEWINFDCPFVVKHYGANNMQKLQKEFTDKGVVWLSICSSAEGKQGHFDYAEINKRIADQKAKMTAYLIDEDGTVGKIYGAKVTPHIYIIDKSGKLVYQGAIDDIKSTDQEDIKKAKNYVKAGLDEVLSGKAVTEKTNAPYGCSVKYK